MIDKRYSHEFRIRLDDDGWATIWDDAGFIQLAPDEVENLRDFLVANLPAAPSVPPQEGP